MKERTEADTSLASCAQEIARTTSTLVGWPMIITDTKGIIIGASDASRLGCHHEASDPVIETNKASQTTTEEAGNYVHTLPGVTYPINGTGGEVVGTLAMTGEPHQLEPFAKLVKKHVEILIREQELLLYSVTRDNSLRNFLEDLAGSNPSDIGSDLLARALAFDFDPGFVYLPLEFDLYQFARFVRQLQSTMGTSDLSALEAEIHRRKQSVLLEIRRLWKDRRTLSSAMPGNHYLVLVPLCSRTGDIMGRRDEVLAEARALCDKLLAQGLKIAVGAGRPQKGLTGIAGSLGQAKKALALGKRIHARPGVYPIDDFQIEQLIPSLPLDLRARFAEKGLGKLRSAKDFKELAATITAWCESGFNLAQAAKLLSAHRNTLIYRLNKISDLTGSDLRTWRGAVTVYLALLTAHYDGPRDKE